MKTRNYQKDLMHTLKVVSPLAPERGCMMSLHFTFDVFQFSNANKKWKIQTRSYPNYVKQKSTSLAFYFLVHIDKV